MRDNIEKGENADDHAEHRYKRKTHDLAKADTEITQDRADCFPVQENVIEGNTVLLPAAAVAAFEIELKEV